MHEQRLKAIQYNDELAKRDREIERLRREKEDFDNSINSYQQQQEQEVQEKASLVINQWQSKQDAYEVELVRPIFGSFVSAILERDPKISGEALLDEAFSAAKMSVPELREREISKRYNQTLVKSQQEIANRKRGVMASSGSAMEIGRPLTQGEIRANIKNKIESILRNT